MKRFLLVCLLASPLLAQADPLNNGALAVGRESKAALVWKASSQPAAINFVSIGKQKPGSKLADADKR